MDNSCARAFCVSPFSILSSFNNSPNVFIYLLYAKIYRKTIDNRKTICYDSFVSVFDITLEGDYTMERKNKACWNCGNYKAYYTKGLCEFDRLDYGLCRKRCETVDKHNQCEFWKSNYSIRTWREDIAKKKLNGVLDEIIQIRQILWEEKEENQSNPKKE